MESTLERIPVESTRADTGQARMRPVTATFTNPIGVGADPFVVQHGEFYYLVEGADGGIWVTRSSAHNLTDIAWAGTRTLVWQAPATGANSKNVWAPELHRVGDRWYIYYTATADQDANEQHRMFVLESSSSDPLSDYRDCGPVHDTANRWAIDGSRFEHDGRAYFVWSGWAGESDGRQNLYIAEMADPFTLIGTGVLISTPDHPWESVSMAVNEGPQALVRDGALHLVYSASGSWTDDYAYGMLTATGSDLLDRASWTKAASPVFEKTSEVFGPGHGSFVTSPDGTQPWMIFHSARRSGSGWDRTMSVQPYTWIDGHPVFGTPLSPTKPRPVPSGQLAAELELTALAQAA